MRAALLVAWKDLRIEFQSKDRLSVLLLVSFVLVFVGSFAYRRQQDNSSHVLALFWIVSVFTQLLFLSEAYRPEMDNRGFDALRISPLRAYQILIGKVLASLVIVLPVNLAIVLEIAFFNNSAHLFRLDIVPLVVLEACGLLVLGNLFFARMAAGEATGFDLYPVVITLAAPLVFQAIEGSQLVIQAKTLDGLFIPYLVLTFYDCFLVVACSWAYRVMIED